MSSQQMQHLLATAIQDVLETMFFSEISGCCEPEAGTPQLGARVSFCGTESGTVAVQISNPSARSLAASFVGESEDSLDDTRIAQVVCELANMLCGSIVTRLETQGRFDLAVPELLDPSETHPYATSEVRQCFAVERGTLTVSVAFSTPA